MIDRAAILARAGKLRTETIPIPAWGGDVTIRELTGAERDQFDLAVDSDRKAGRALHFRARLVAACVVDAEGRLVFGAADVPALSQLPAAELTPIFERALHLQAMTDDDVAEKKSG